MLVCNETICFSRFDNMAYLINTENYNNINKTEKNPKEIKTTKNPYKYKTKNKTNKTPPSQVFIFVVWSSPFLYPFAS